ncbi:MAG TPA: urease subunit beta [Ruminiclostridium sp.]
MGFLKIPGEIIAADREIILNSGRETITLLIANLGDRPIQVGSHFHLFEANRLLRFDREKAFGFRFDIPSGTSVRFEPGEEKQVNLVKMGGNGKFYGGNNLTCGKSKEEAVKIAVKNGFIKKEAQL